LDWPEVSAACVLNEIKRLSAQIHFVMVHPTVAAILLRSATLVKLLCFSEFEALCFKSR
jgi:hypothetical protein